MYVVHMCRGARGDRGGGGAAGSVHWEGAGNGAHCVLFFSSNQITGAILLLKCDWQAEHPARAFPFPRHPTPHTHTPRAVTRLPARRFSACASMGRTAG
jgi:hypothetical protein